MNNQSFPSGIGPVRVHFSGWTLDFDARELQRGADSVHIVPKQFRLLEVLIERRPSAVSSEQLIDCIWPNTYVDKSNLPCLVKDTRAVLQDDAREPRIIKTLHGYGYAFMADVRIEETPQPKVKAVAVLPFSNNSGPELDYLSDGIAGDLLNALTRLRSLRVVPRTTSFRFRGPNVDVRMVAREMAADALVSGRIEVRGDDLTVQVDLINVSQDSVIWGNRIRARTSELLRVQNEIESEIVTRIAELSGLRADVEVSVRENDAYTAFLQGQHLCSLRDSDGFQRAIQAFEKATQLNPGFDRAHAALAEAYVALGSREIDPPCDIFPRAKEASRRALEINGSLAAAHTALAAVQELYDYDRRAAEASHRTAVKLDPHYASSQHWFALYFARGGEHDEAKYWIDKAIKLEQLSPIIRTNAAFVAYLAHDFKASVQLSETALDLAPHFEAAHTMRGVAYLHIDPKRAVEELEEANRLSKRQPYTLMHLASAYAAAGDVKAAGQIRDEVWASSKEKYVSSSVIATIELAVGNLSGALEAFERAAGQRSPWLSYLLCEPRLDVLRSEPRFRSLIASIGLAR